MNQHDKRGPWLTAREASTALGVSRATLYAYVSRGLIRSQAAAGPSRERRYADDDVQRLRRRAEDRRDPAKATSRALQWGGPVLESAITFIDGRTLYYRGHDAVALARSRSFREVASLIWTGGFDATFPDAATPVPALAVPRTVPFAARAHCLLALASADDPLAFDLRTPNVVRCGGRILRLVAIAASGSSAPSPDIVRMLARAWHVRGNDVEVLRAALILCADHELNASSFTARCAASAGSNPYAVVTAALAALEGPKHGGASARVAAMVGAMRNVRSLSGAIGDRLRRGEPVSGFGHPLYPDGDPRATALIDLLRTGSRRSTELAYLARFVDAAAVTVGERPNLDFALVAVARVLRLPTHGPLALFAIGRAVGWIGHAIEQYATGQLIRPRANYVGPVPMPDPEAATR